MVESCKDDQQLAFAKFTSPKPLRLGQLACTEPDNKLIEGPDRCQMRLPMQGRLDLTGVPFVPLIYDRLGIPKRDGSTKSKADSLLPDERGVRGRWPVRTTRHPWRGPSES